MKNLGVVGWVALVLVLIGAYNIGFMGASDEYNVLHGIFGRIPALLRTIYVAIGLSAIWVTYLCFKKGK